MSLAETARLAVDLSLTGNFGSGLGRAEGDLSRFNATVNRTAYRIGQDLGTGIKTAVHNLERLAIIAGGAVVTGLSAAVKVAGDFEAQLNTIATIVDRKDIPQIGEDLRKIARDTGIGLTDLTAAYYDLASAGIKGTLATEALTDAVTLGIGGLATTTETVDLLTTAINAYGLDARGAAVATDQFALAVADGKVKASEIAATFANIASVAKAYGVGIDQIAASFAFLTAQGVDAAEVTTEMQRAIVSLINPSSELAAAQKKLGVVFAEEIRKKGLVPALQEIRDYSEKTGIPLNALLGRIEAVKYVLQTTGPSLQGYNAELAKMGQAAGTAARQMAEREQGLNFQLGRLKANVIDAGITIGTELIPILADATKELADFLRGHQPEIKAFARDLANGLRDAVGWLKSLDWDAIAGGLRAAAGFAKGLVDVFMALPTETKGILIGLAGLNKLSGGAVVKIGVDLVGGVLEQFIARGSPINPMYVVPLGGGLGPPGGPPIGPPVPGGRPMGPTDRFGPLQYLGWLGAAAALPQALKSSEFGKVVDEYQAKIDAKYGTPSKGFMTLPRPGTREERPLTTGPQPFAQILADLFGTHGAAAGAFGAAQLKSFRGSAAGAVELFDERIRYLAGAQGAGAGSAQYLGLVSRDIAALKSLLPQASADQKTAITSEIQTLEGILAAKKFTLTPDVLKEIRPSPEDQKRTAESIYTSVEKMRGGLTLPGAETTKRKTSEIADHTREAIRTAKTGTRDVTSRIDYARIDTARHLNATQSAIETWLARVVAAIQGQRVTFNVTTADITRKQAAATIWQATTTMNSRGRTAS